MEEDAYPSLLEFCEEGFPLPRIKLTRDEEATGMVQEVFADIERVRGQGRVSNLFRGYSAFPELLQVNWLRMKVLMGGGTLSRKLKESIMLSLAEINGCDY